MPSADEPMSLEIAEPSTPCRRSAPSYSKGGTGGLRRLSSFTEQLASDEPALSWQDTCPSAPGGIRPRVAFSDSARIGTRGNCRCSRPEADRGRPSSLLRPRKYQRFARTKVRHSCASAVRWRFLILKFYAFPNRTARLSSAGLEAPALDKL